jgi:hypothetical protein
MNFVQGMLKARIRWRVTLKRRPLATAAGQDGRRKVEEVFAPDKETASAIALHISDNGKYFVIESIREVR